MKTAILITALAMSAGAGAADHSTRGYVRSNGTYVQPHMQTNPNSTRLDNYSTRGNVNPYTGQAGTVSPFYAPPQRVAPMPISGYGMPRVNGEQ